MNIIQFIQKVAREAVEQARPCDIIYATKTEDALRIDALPIDVPMDMVHIPTKMKKIEGKMTCELIEGEGVEIEGSGSMRSIKLTDVPVAITMEMTPGDRLLVLRHAGGQRFTVLDKY